MGPEVGRGSGKVFPRKKHLSSFLKENSGRENAPAEAKGCWRAPCCVHGHVSGWTVPGEPWEEAGPGESGLLTGLTAFECCPEGAGEPGSRVQGS